MYFDYFLIHYVEHYKKDADLPLFELLKMKVGPKQRKTKRYDAAIQLFLSVQNCVRWKKTESCIYFLQFHNDV